MNDPIVFDNVVIRLLRQTDENKPDVDVFEAQVRQAPIPLHGGTFKANISPALEELHECFTERVELEQTWYEYTTDPADLDDSEKEEREKIEKMKEQLDQLADKFHNLLPVSLRHDLPRLIQQVFERGRGVRLIIEASAGDQADRLLSLPWELLFFKETRLYPARSNRFLIVRRLLDAMRHAPIEVKAPFDVVHVIAIDDPEDPITDLREMECDTIPVAIGSGDYTPVAEYGSVQELLDVMRRRQSMFSQDKPPRSHIIHFLGHGEAGDGDGIRGYLSFVGENGDEEYVTGEQLQHLLSGTPRVQLVVLNACHGGAVVTSNIALDLVYNGFPYVVAMQDAFAQEAAKHFIRAFYSELQQGRTIEYAVAAARFEIGAQLPGAIDWCLPVLYTNVGLPDKPLLVGIWGMLDQWLKQLNNLIAINLGLALLHLLAGGFLWLEGITRSLPNADLMLWTTGWVVGVPPFLALLIYQVGELPIPSNWSSQERLILSARLVGIAAFALGASLLYALSFSVLLLASVGIWESLSPLSQVLLLIPFIIIALLLSSMVTYRSALKFIPVTQIAKVPWSEGIGPLIAGYGYLLAWLYFSYSPPSFYSPPRGNLFIGVILLVISYLLHHFRPYGEDEPAKPFTF